MAIQVFTPLFFFFFFLLAMSSWSQHWTLTWDGNATYLCCITCVTGRAWDFVSRRTISHIGPRSHLEAVAEWKIIIQWGGTLYMVCSLQLLHTSWHDQSELSFIRWGHQLSCLTWRSLRPGLFAYLIVSKVENDLAIMISRWSYHKLSSDSTQENIFLVVEDRITRRFDFLSTALRDVNIFLSTKTNKERFE